MKYTLHKHLLDSTTANTAKITVQRLHTQREQGRNLQNGHPVFGRCFSLNIAFSVLQLMPGYTPVSHTLFAARGTMALLSSQRMRTLEAWKILADCGLWGVRTNEPFSPAHPLRVPCTKWRYLLYKLKGDARRRYRARLRVTRNHSIHSTGSHPSSCSDVFKGSYIAPTRIRRHISRLRRYALLFFVTSRFLSV